MFVEDNWDNHLRLSLMTFMMDSKHVLKLTSLSHYTLALRLR